MISIQASNEVIKQAHSLRQQFKINISRKSFRQRPFHISTQAYEFSSLSPIKKSICREERFLNLPRVNACFNSIDKCVKGTFDKKIYMKPKAQSPILVKSLENSILKINRNDYFIEKKKKFALHLHLPIAEIRPSSKESIITKSSGLLHVNDN